MIKFVGKSLNKINSCKKHKHNCWEVVIPTSGSGTVEAGTEKMLFCTNCVYIIPPETPHILYSEENFSDIYIHTDDLKLDDNKITVLYDIDEIPFLGNLIYNYYSKKEQGYYGRIECTLNLILNIIYEHLSFKKNNLTLNIKNFIIDNISSCDLSMEMLSKHFGYNADYIRRIFKSEMGVTPKEYLNILRINRAKELLKNMPIYRIDEISNVCGFRDQFYFSRLFKKITGVSPKKFINEKTEFP